MSPFAEFLDVPANSCVLLDSEDEAKNYPRGDIVLGACRQCGFIGNIRFDMGLAQYTSRYEETQGYSPTFRKFHRQLATDLIERHGLRNKDVLEIGCGKGEFLAMLCELGPNRGTGFDPSFDEGRDIFPEGVEARVIRDFFSEEHVGIDADIVCCKMTLEHIPNVEKFARLACGAMRDGDDAVVFFQVPNALRILRDCAFEDIYYEHCSYFTAGSLGRLFRSFGLAIHRLTTEYADQYLAIEAVAAKSPIASDELQALDDVDEIERLVSGFEERCSTKIGSWQQQLDAASEAGDVVLWGSGSKAVAFLSAVDNNQAVKRVVDINPHKHGYYLPGSAQKIISPDELAAEHPRTVIVMNSVYQEEIIAALRERCIDAEVLSL
jgi:SAM-dependent methyltransferase